MFSLECYYICKVRRFRIKNSSLGLYKVNKITTQSCDFNDFYVSNDEFLIRNQSYFTVIIIFQSKQFVNLFILSRFLVM
jgi:hypothetical protein